MEWPTVLLFLGAVAYLFAQFIKDKRKLMNDSVTNSASTIDLLNKQIDGLQKIIADNKQEAKERQMKRELENKAWEDKFHDMDKQLVALRTTVQEKDAKLSEYISIFQNHNPKIDGSIDKILAVATFAETWMVDIKKGLDALAKDMVDVKKTLEINKRNDDVSA